MSAATLRMSFRNEAGRTVSISIDSPRVDLAAADVENAMDTIIDRNIITTTGGDLVSIVRARIISSTVTELIEP